MPSTMSNSQELTREQVQSVLLDPLLPASRFLSAGPRIFDSPSGDPLRIPIIKTYDLLGPGGASAGASAAYWAGETDLIAEANPDFGETVLLPTARKSLKVITRFSSELARHAVVDIASALSGAITRRLSIELDRAFLTGNGADDTITGVTSWAGTQEILGVGPLTLTDMLDAEGMLLAANAVPTAWFVAPQILTAMRRWVDGDNRPLLQPDVTAASGLRLLGYPVLVTPVLGNAAASSVILADMSMVAVGRDLAPSFKVLDQTFATTDELALRVVTRWDTAPIDAAGIVVLRGVTA